LGLLLLAERFVLGLGIIIYIYINIYIIR
jgi:hypothetical protein